MMGSKARKTDGSRVRGDDPSGTVGQACFIRSCSFSLVRFSHVALVLPSKAFTMLAATVVQCESRGILLRGLLNPTLCKISLRPKQRF